MMSWESEAGLMLILFFIIALGLENRWRMKKIHKAVIDHHFYNGHPEED